MIVGWFELKFMYLVKEFSFMQGVLDLIRQIYYNVQKIAFGHFDIESDLKTYVFKDLNCLLFHVFKVLVVYVSNDC